VAVDIRGFIFNFCGSATQLPQRQMLRHFIFARFIRIGKTKKETYRAEVSRMRGM
jgi:hypothetical protein